MDKMVRIIRSQWIYEFMSIGVHLPIEMNY